MKVEGEALLISSVHSLLRNCVYALEVRHWEICGDNMAFADRLSEISRELSLPVACHLFTRATGEDKAILHLPGKQEA
jgi:hypothetical protein